MTSHSYLSIAETSRLSQAHLQVVKRGDCEQKFKAAGLLLSLAEELKTYILGFLSCRDILRCTSVCKALRQTYLSSSDLQYIVELSGQHLLPVPNTDNHTPISERLQLLRDNAHAWFKFNYHSFKTVTIPPELLHGCKIFTRRHLCLWNDDLVTIIPILPKSPQQPVEWWQTPLSPLISVPHSEKLDVFIDLAQNLIVIVYVVDETLYIDLGALNGGGVHPQAAGPRLFLSVLQGHDEHQGYNEDRLEMEIANLRGSGRHIALLRTSDTWELQIWDWQHSTTSNCFLSGDLIPIDLCFFGNNRLIVVSDTLKLYSIEDMSRMPQLLACFLIPIPVTQCFLPMEPQILAQQTYTSNPEHQLLCMTTFRDSIFSERDTFVYIISTRIFFDLDGLAAATPISWNRWGPSNTRIFKHNYEGKVHLCGNRVLLGFPVRNPATSHSDQTYYHAGPTHFIMHMMDFSPLAVVNRRDLGRVVKEPSTIDISDFTDSSQEAQSLITSLPYVEVVSDREFGVEELEDIWIDQNRIYLFLTDYEPKIHTRELGVIEV